MNSKQWWQLFLCSGCDTYVHVRSCYLGGSQCPPCPVRPTSSALEDSRKGLARYVSTLFSVCVCKLIHFWEVTCAADKYVGLLYSWRAWRLLVINVLLAAENQIRLLDSHCPSATHVFCHCKHVVEFHSSKTHKGTFICYVAFFLERLNNPR